MAFGFTWKLGELGGSTIVKGSRRSFGGSGGARGRGAPRSGGRLGVILLLLLRETAKERLMMVVDQATATRAGRLLASSSSVAPLISSHDHGYGDEDEECFFCCFFCFFFC